jgi:TMEM175 potassium channel family protein
MSPGRLEAFSDGVFAIAITLLVLDIHVPDPSTTADLAQQLGSQWPSYVAYGVSFLTIGIIWINHHAMLRRIKAIDHEILILNLLLMLCVGLLPFTTALMAAYLKESEGETLAAAIYAGSFLLMSVVFAAMNWTILFRKDHLLAGPIDAATRRTIITRGVAGLLPYLAATILAVLSPYVSLAICGAVAAFYALPLASGDEETAAPA